jgi:hypothetical protein
MRKSPGFTALALIVQRGEAVGHYADHDVRLGIKPYAPADGWDRLRTYLSRANA